MWVVCRCVLNRNDPVKVWPKLRTNGPGEPPYVEVRLGIMEHDLEIPSTLVPILISGLQEAMAGPVYNNSLIQVAASLDEFYAVTKRCKSPGCLAPLSEEDKGGSCVSCRGFYTDSKNPFSEIGLNPALRDHWMDKLTNKKYYPPALIPVMRLLRRIAGKRAPVDE